jgi:hypothetical protein
MKIPNFDFSLGCRDLRTLAGAPWGVYSRRPGQVAEWLKAHAWKVCNGESRSRVRIPLCPPIRGNVRKSGISRRSDQLGKKKPRLSPAGSWI